MRRRSRQYDRYEPMLATYASLGADDPRRPSLRRSLVQAFLPVAKNIARRYRGRGEPVEDLEQVARIGLLNALERFDPELRRDFLSYAIPTMTGEVRRHFRDATWAIRTPRGVKERYAAVGAATSSMSQELGRAPTVEEVATQLELSRVETLEAIGAAGAYRTASLDETLLGSDTELVERLGDVDPGFAHVEVDDLVATLLRELPDRERRMMALRFVEEKTQTQIAGELGISQMHVSRLLARTLAGLRVEVERQFTVAGDN